MLLVKADAKKIPRTVAGKRWIRERSTRSSENAQINLTTPSTKTEQIYSWWSISEAVRKDTIVWFSRGACLSAQAKRVLVGCKLFSWGYQASKLATDSEGKVIGGNGKQKNERTQEKSKKI